MTGGSGTYEYEFARYEQAPADVQQRRSRHVRRWLRSKLFIICKETGDCGRNAAVPECFCPHNLPEFPSATSEKLDVARYACVFLLCRMKIHPDDNSVRCYRYVSRIFASIRWPRSVRCIPSTVMLRMPSFSAALSKRSCTEMQERLAAGKTACICAVRARSS